MTKKRFVFRNVVAIAICLAGATMLLNCGKDPNNNGPITVKPDTNVSSSTDFLKSEGKNIRNNSGTGDIVHLRGTNVGGMFLQEFWMTPTQSVDNKCTAQGDIYQVLTERFGLDKALELIHLYEDNFFTEWDFDYCAGLGMNCFRLVLYYRQFVDGNGNYYGYDAAAADPYATAFAKLDWFIQQASKRKMYVILDMHGAPGSQNGMVKGGENEYWNSDRKVRSRLLYGQNDAEKNYFQDMYLNMWGIIANRYKDNPWVAAYDILNEPHCAGTADRDALWALYNKTYRKIRGIDPNHIITMMATSGNLADFNKYAKQYNFTNIMSHFHFSTSEKDVNTVLQQITPNVTQLTGFNFPVYGGEVSFGPNLDAWDTCLKMLVDSGINYTNWSYKLYNSFSQNNWGYFYMNNNNQNKVDLTTATEDQIRQKWGDKIKSQNAYTKNTAMADVYKKYLTK